MPQRARCIDTTHRQRKSTFKEKSGKKTNENVKQIPHLSHARTPTLQWLWFWYSNWVIILSPTLCVKVFWVWGPPTPPSRSSCSWWSRWCSSSQTSSFQGLYTSPKAKWVLHAIPYHESEPVFLWSCCLNFDNGDEGWGGHTIFELGWGTGRESDLGVYFQNSNEMKILW